MQTNCASARSRLRGRLRLAAGVMKRGRLLAATCAAAAAFGLLPAGTAAAQTATTSNGECLRLLVFELCASSQEHGELTSLSTGLTSALSNLTSALHGLPRTGQTSLPSPAELQAGLANLVGRLEEALHGLPQGLAGGANPTALLERLKGQLAQLGDLQMAISPESLRQLTAEIGCELKSLLTQLLSSSPAQAVSQVVGELTKLGAPLSANLSALGAPLEQATNGLAQVLGSLVGKLITTAAGSPLGQLTSQLSEPFGDLVAPVVAALGVRCLNTPIANLCLNDGAEGLAGLICAGAQQAGGPGSTPPPTSETSAAGGEGKGPQQGGTTSSVQPQPTPSTSPAPATTPTKPSSTKKRSTTHKRGHAKRKAKHRKHGKGHRRARAHHKGHRHGRKARRRAHRVRR